MTHTHSISPLHPRDASETLTIRMTTPADAEALSRLAELDSASPPRLGPTLVAEVAGELHAAMPLDGGPAIADPFRRTEELVALLATRVRQLEVPAAGPVRRRVRAMELLRATDIGGS